MSYVNLKVSTLIMLSCSIFLFPLHCYAQEESVDDIPRWKVTNNKAIQAMREERFGDSEKLFQQALTECPTPDGKATIKDNIDVLLKKEGKMQEARVEKNESVTTSPQSGMMMDGRAANPEQSSQIHQTIAQIDAEIKKADEKGDLEMLQELFQKKGQALKLRDSGETLDYAYCLHFRAQVLQQLHRDAEANALEAQASRLRDALRQLSASGPAPPSKTKSALGELNLQPLPPPPTRPIQTVQQSYASTTPVNTRGPRSWRNFAPANGNDTSGFLNGNPNQPNSW